MERMPAKKLFSRLGFGMVIFFVLPEVLFLLIYTLVGLLAPQVLEASWFLLVAMYGSMYLVAFPLLLLVFRSIPNGTGGPQEKVKLSAGQMLGLVAVGFGMVGLLSFLSNLLAQAVSLIKGSPPVNTVEAVLSGGNLWVNFFIVVLLAPVMEELVFRGLLYKKLIPYGGKVYIFFSALFFALFHKNIYQLFFAFALGLLWGAVTYYTGSIRYSIVLHMGQNFLGGGLAMLLQAFAPEGALEVWGFVSLGLMLAGVVLGIVWLLRRRQDIVFAPAGEVLPAKHVYLLGLGMIFFWLVAAFFLVSSLLV